MYRHTLLIFQIIYEQLSYININYKPFVDWLATFNHEAKRVHYISTAVLHYLASRKRVLIKLISSGTSIC